MRRWFEFGAWHDMTDIERGPCPICRIRCPAIGIERFALASADSDDYSLKQALWRACATCQIRWLAGIQQGPGASTPGRAEPYEPVILRHTPRGVTGT